MHVCMTAGDTPKSIAQQAEQMLHDQQECPPVELPPLQMTAAERQVDLC